MAKIKKDANAQIPAREASDRRKDLIDITRDIFKEENIKAGAEDIALMGTALDSIVTVLGRDWEHLRETANQKSEGEIVATLRVNVPFGKHNQEIHTQISFGGKKFTDEEKVLVGDPAQLKLKV